MHNHPCTHLWVGEIKHKYPVIGDIFRAKYGDFYHTIESERACRSSNTRARCMSWYMKYIASQKPCRSPATCGCRQDTPERQAWRASTNLCNNASS